MVCNLLNYRFHSFQSFCMHCTESAMTPYSAGVCPFTKWIRSPEENSHIISCLQIHGPAPIVRMIIILSACTFTVSEICLNTFHIATFPPLTCTIPNPYSSWSRRVMTTQNYHCGLLMISELKFCHRSFQHLIQIKQC